MHLDLPADAKVAYLTQTTLSVDDANRIIERLRQRFPQLVGPPRDDICYATQNRQRRCGSWRARRMWCWSWAARTAPTASGCRNWPRNAASTRT